MRPWMIDALFAVVVLAIGTGIGLITAPGEWYAGLTKPSFNPPNWLFGPVWSVLYILIGIAGGRTFRTDRGSRGMMLWWGQMALNFAWTPVFFGAQAIGPALVIILALLLAILAFIADRWRRDRPAALMFLPYAAWVGFASALNFAIWQLNPGA